MQKLVPLLLVLSVQCVYSVSLQEDLLDLELNVPKEKISQLFVQYIIQDVQFRHSIRYVRSDEFSDTWNQFLELAKVHQLLLYMQNAGLPIDKVLHMFAGFTGIQPPSTKFKRSLIKRGGLNAFIEDVVQVVAQSDVKTMTEEKKRLSSQFLEMTEKLNSDEYKRLFTEAFDDPDVIILQQELQTYDIELPKLLELMKAFFGWSAFF
ncbi:protein G12-like [Wyeomyia smithii]|uniref:protein G12-like n=1 Tax=Wyeomyia smithii TaxID=174621 RepID=UPI002467BDC8|nr:protein G12-like [Wyeomyia smithii]